jgi:hypothetical protein
MTLTLQGAHAEAANTVVVVRPVQDSCACVWVAV